MDIMFYEVFSEEEEALKRYLPAGIVAGFTAETVQAGSRKTPPAKLICVRTQSIVPESWEPGLSGILTRSAGYDHLDYFKKDSVKVSCGYLPKYCTQAVAEHALLLTLYLLKKLGTQVRHMSDFNRDSLTGLEMPGKKVFVLGVGNIGADIAALFKKMEMHVSGFDIDHRVKNLEYVDLDTGLSGADVVICALPLTGTTRGLLNYERLKRAKKGAVVVNVSRGEVTPAADLVKLMSEGILGGVGLDVYEDEQHYAEYLRTGKGSPGAGGKALKRLAKMENVVFTPHNAFNTAEALEKKAQQSCEALVKFLNDGVFPDMVPVK